MRAFRIGAALAAAIMVLPALGQMTLDRPLDAPQPFHLDSGALENTANVMRNLHVERVEVPGAGWMRLYFGDVELGRGSFIRLTSELDGEVQELDADALAVWSNSSAYFNGEAVTVELVAGPKTTGNRLVIEELAWEAGVAVPAGTCGICGADDRVPSNEDWAARLLPAGCSSAVYNTDSCVVSAGHCVGGGMVIQFRVPDSNSNCNINNPPVADQFPITSFQFNNGGVGEDWSVMIPGTNNQGQLPIDRYGQFRPIATSPPSNTQGLDIWGYGIDSQCTRSQTQQHSVGAVTGVGGTFFNHNADATFGNSGSSILRDGEILGIVTHCPCPNWATRVDHPAFVAARDSLCPTSAEPQDAPLTGVNVIVGNLTGGGLADLQSADSSYVIVNSVPQGIRNNTITEISAVSPLPIVSELAVRVEVGPASASPVFLLIGLFDFDSGFFRYIDFSLVSTDSNTLRILNVPNPNAFVDGSGNVRIRLVQTARSVETPGGYTTLIDHVEATIVP